MRRFYSHSKKKRGPFTGLYDLPGWKIEHWENHIFSLEREIKEEIWLKPFEISIESVLTVEEDFVNHIWEGQPKNEHIIAIIYIVKVLNDGLNINFIEKWWDSGWMKIIKSDDKNLLKTNILNKAIQKYLLNELH